MNLVFRRDANEQLFYHTSAGFSWRTMTSSVRYEDVFPDSRNSPSEGQFVPLLSRDRPLQQ